jgi:hypothetical protein
MTSFARYAGLNRFPAVYPRLTPGATVLRPLSRAIGVLNIRVPSGKNQSQSNADSRKHEVLNSCPAIA